jgi:cysteine synthase B
MIVSSITELIGNTPLLRIAPEVHGLPKVDLYAKLELCNPFGSVKDRIAWEFLRAELPRLREQKIGLIENSSGNTAKAIAVIAGMHNVPFRLVSSMVRVQETKDILTLLGVEVEEVPGALNCFDPNDPNDPQYLIQKQVAAAGGGLFFTSQFTNETNPKTHYSSTGRELERDLTRVDFLCSGLGTSGSTLGIVQRLRESNPSLVSVGITAGRSDFIPGLRTMEQLWETGFFRRDAYDEFSVVESREAIDGMLTLIRKCGLLCGPSAGANYCGAVRYLSTIAESFKDQKTAVFIACDRAEWYLSYIKERRPELFGKRADPRSIFSLSQPQIALASEIAPDAVDGWTAENNPLIVDVRNSIAFELGSIDDAINVPLEHLEKLLDLRAPFSGYERKVLFVCPVGEQSRRCAAQLTRRGGQGFSLAGGLQMWRAQGRSLSRILQEAS